MIIMIINGGMVKLVNTTDLKSVALIGLPGSSPGVPTIKNNKYL